MAGGSESNFPPTSSFLLMDSVVVVLYEPELLSWYSASAVTAAGISLFDSSFFFNEFVLFGFTCDVGMPQTDLYAGTGMKRAHT